MNRRLAFACSTALIVATLSIAVRAEDGASADEPSAVTIFPHGDMTWWLSAQINLIEQGHPSFDSTYEGPNSFRAAAEHAVSRVLTLYTGVHLGHGWEAIVDVESAGGRGLSDALGLAGFTNLDVVRDPTLGAAPYLARAMIRKVIAMSDQQVQVQATPLALTSSLPARRLEIRAGKLGIVDIFDVNAVHSGYGLLLSRPISLPWGYMQITTFGAVAMGAVFIASGVFAILVGAGIIPRSDADAASWVIGTGWRNVRLRRPRRRPRLREHARIVASVCHYSCADGCYAITMAAGRSHISSRSSSCRPRHS